MKNKKKYDFSGYATKNGLKCSDGRTILQNAFEHQDGQTVPLVWQHLHNDPINILGHAVLENRKDGVYCYCKFNDTDSGKSAKELVAHGDITNLSIYANQLQEQAKKVMHGTIREVSLVLAGANPGAVIDNLTFAHGDGSEVLDDTEAIIYTGLELEHSDDIEHSDDDPDEVTVGDIYNTFTKEQKGVVEVIIAHAVKESTGEELELDEDTLDAIVHGEDSTVQDVFDTFNDEQKQVVYYLIASALGGEEEDTTPPPKQTPPAKKSATPPAKKDTNPAPAKHSNIDDEGEDVIMKHNVFNQPTKQENKNVLSHAQVAEIIGDAKKYGSLRDSFMEHTAAYGFDPISILFPDAKEVSPGGLGTIQRDMTWVDVVLNETTHTPFARIRSTFADITADEARAKGYITGHLKKEEIIPLLRRSTTPTTVYKKQKLDRDDMVDITDLDVVVWLKAEMKMMLNEEIARAVLVGDGRDIASEDKINEQNIRPILMDNDSVYVHRIEVAHDALTDDIVDEFIRARKFYKGSGVPTLFTSTDLLTEMLLIKDKQGRRIYGNVTELASVLRVSKIVEVELLNNITRKVSDTQKNSLLGIVVNLKDYTIGADKGGQVAMFDDFDIDYNQFKYLIETRCSGALTVPKSALILEQLPATNMPG